MGISTKSDLMGIFNLSENSLLRNPLPLISKYYVYDARANRNLSIESLQENIYKTKNIERGIIKDHAKKFKLNAMQNDARSEFCNYCICSVPCFLKHKSLLWSSMV